MPNGFSWMSFLYEWFKLLLTREVNNNLGELQENFLSMLMRFNLLCKVERNDSKAGADYKG